MKKSSEVTFDCIDTLEICPFIDINFCFCCLISTICLAKILAASSWFFLAKTFISACYKIINCKLTFWIELDTNFCSWRVRFLISLSKLRSLLRKSFCCCLSISEEFLHKVFLGAILPFWLGPVNQPMIKTPWIFEDGHLINLFWIYFILQILNNLIFNC